MHENRYSNTFIHDHSLLWFDTDTSIKSGCVKLVLWTKISPVSEMCCHASSFQMWVTWWILLIICYCFPNCFLQIKDGVMKKKDFDHILATPDMKQEVLGLRGPLREETPDVRTGNIK